MGRSGGHQWGVSMAAYGEIPMAAVNSPRPHDHKRLELETQQAPTSHKLSAGDSLHQGGKRAQGRLRLTARRESSLRELFHNLIRERSPTAARLRPQPVVQLRLLPRLSELERALNLRGSPFLLAQGLFKGAIAPAALRAIARQPSAPRARHPLRGLPPVLELSRLPPLSFVPGPGAPIRIATGGPSQSPITATRDDYAPPQRPTDACPRARPCDLYRAPEITCVQARRAESSPTIIHGGPDFPGSAALGAAGSGGVGHVRA
jgi:hypothetical protein